MQPETIIERIRRGNFTGLNFAGLTRLSFERNQNPPANGRPMTGADIVNRETQERRLREYVESRGGTYVYTYDEPDTSAWKRKRIQQADGGYIYRVIRPVFQDALRGLSDGVAPNGMQIHGAITLDLDRLTRNHRDLEDAIDAVDHSGRPIIDLSGTLDLLTQNGRDMARIMVTMKGRQSADTSRRLKDSHYDRALEGIPVGGTRPFGWADDKRTLLPREAEAIRRAADDLLNGVAVYTIAKRWHEAGIVSPKGKVFRKRSFVLMMLSPRLVGWRVYGPLTKPIYERYAVDSNGQPVQGQYPAILDVETWQKVVAILAGPGRPEGHDCTGKRRYLLSGIVRCGNCHIKLRGGAQPHGHNYQCKPPMVDGGCGKVCGSGKPIDQMVTQLVMAYLADRELATEVAPWSGQAALDELTAKKASLLQQFQDNPDMGAYIWPKVRQLEAQMKELSKDRSAYFRKTAGPKVTNVAAEWDGLELEQQRAIIAEVVDVVLLDPATRGSNRFDTNRLRIVWREG